jgi:hemerythrin-like domain-containing protein
MSDNSEGFGSGILRGLKKVLFTSGTEDEQVVKTPAAAPETPPVKEPASPVFAQHSTADAGVREMKLRVYQLLENMNKPGVDFFEVWNAAVEMGGTNISNIKSAYTSLKFADKSLSKAKLLESGAAYMAGLKSVIETESHKRLDEKAHLEKEKEQVKSSLVAEISSLEQQIVSLQERLAAQKREKETIEEKFAPKIADIDYKINAGRQSVSSVMSEMQQVLDIINKELN